MAPRPKPTQVKLMQGTLQKCRTNPNEPKPAIEVPMAPDWLPDDIKEIFNEMALHFADMRVMSKADGKALELLADAYHEYREARKFIHENGSTYESATKEGKIIRAYPQVAIASDAFKRLRAMLIEFGATPAARSRVGMVPEAKEENPFKRLMRKAEERRNNPFHPDYRPADRQAADDSD